MNVETSRLHFKKDEIAQIIKEHSPGSFSFFWRSGLISALSACTFDELRQLSKIARILSEGKINF